jgi:cytochrome c553
MTLKTRHMKLLVLVSLAAVLTADVHAQTTEREMPPAAQLCANCHVQTLDQQQTPDAQLTPLLGHQQPQYLQNALQAYAKRQRDHFFMRGIAAGLSADQLSEVARYFSSAPPSRARMEGARPPMPIAAGRCVACHGDASRGPVANDIPRLAGQHAPHLKGAFLGYANGTRRHAVMQAMARDAQGEPSLSSDDLDAVTRWYSGLPNGVSGQQ